MSPQRILVEIDGPRADITLNRPEIHNAFDEVLIAEVTEAFTILGANTTLRAVVLRGAGPSFCAGADLAWMGRMAGYSQEENLADARALQQMFAAIAHCRAVTIARVHGAAIGGGAGLVAVCDISIAAEEAKFALSEVRLGIVPAVIAPYVLEKVHIGAARALFVSGERFDAKEAFRLGLVQQVTSATELDEALRRKVALICEAGPEAVATAKSLLRSLADKTPDEAADLTVACIAALRVSAEGQEGIRAFLEKRPPAFGKIPSP